MDLREELLEAVFAVRGRRDVLPLSRRGLRVVAEARAALDSLEAELVVRSRRDGITWAEIGSDLGAPPTTIRGRYPHLRRRARLPRGPRGN